jgi:hydrogenase nickel incorporation protein HypB
MCSTCGCGEPDSSPSIMTPEEAKLMINDEHHHSHSHTLEHHHHDDNHHHHHHHDEHDHSHSRIDIEQDILLQNNLMAQRNRGYFEAKNVFSVNLVSSPGSGKTTLLEKTITALKDKHNFFVIEGDQQTMNDAERIEKTGASVVQINTRAGCHLDADMVNKSVKKMNITDNSFVMIENVGNLVCPAAFDLGENKRVIIMSITEGEDKPAKYPDMFRSSDLCIINKMDLKPYLEFDLEKAMEFAKRVNPKLEFIKVSAKTGSGLDEWYNWLEKHL